MNKLSRSALSLLPLLVAGPAFCLQSDALTFEYRATTQWPTSFGTPGTMTRCIAGDFNGDGVRDLLALVGSHPVLLRSTDTWESVELLNANFSCVDCDRIPVATANPQPQNNVAALCSSGLLSLSYSASTNNFSSTVLSSNSLWTGATLLKAGFINSNTTPDYVALCPAKDGVPTKIAVMIDGGTPTSFGLTGVTVYDIGLVQYDGTGNLDIMLLDSYGVEVFLTDGARVKRFARPTTTLADAFCTFHKNSDSREHIAWFRTKSGSTDQELAELHYESDVNASQIALNTTYFSASDRVVHAIPIASTTTADSVNTDSNLLLSTTGSYEPRRMNYHSTSIGSATFSSGMVELIGDGMTDPDITIAGSTSMPPLVVDDFSGDLVPDLVLPVRDGSSLSFLMWRYVEVPDGPYEVDDPSQNFIESPVLVYAATGTDNSLSLNVKNFPDPGDTGANCLEVVVWSCAASTTADPVTYQPEGHFYYQSSTGSYPTVTGGLLHINVRLHLTTDGTTSAVNNSCYPRLYWMEARQAAVQSDGTLRAKSATYVAAVASSHSPLTPWFEDFSRSACMELSTTWPTNPEPGCAECSTSAGTHAVSAPGTMTRHRIAPTGTPPVPGIAEQVVQ